MNEFTYKKAGVDRAFGEQTKAQIKELARSTFSESVLKDIGLFGGFYQLDAEKASSPVLVSSIDGVGTKIDVAQMVGQYGSIGEDLVNHCVNDIMVCGADPIFFLDYLAADHLKADVIQEIVRGIARACKHAGCALIGGETAEMPGTYVQEKMDVVGAIVGLVEKDAIIDGSKVGQGDVLIGVASNGLHTNGFSLVRKVLFEHKNYRPSDYLAELDSSLGEELLKTHRSYQRLIQTVREDKSLHGIAHVTGGGIVDNTRRLLPGRLEVQIYWSAWEVPPIFKIIQKEGRVSDSEMQQVFNLGVGLVLVVENDSADRFLRLSKTNMGGSYLIGTVVSK
ncbi:MAG: phosphoribosylformylglycinamidine cyclo-ligase [bacterium]